MDNNYNYSNSDNNNGAGGYGGQPGYGTQPSSGAYSAEQTNRTANASYSTGQGYGTEQGYAGNGYNPYQQPTGTPQMQAQAPRKPKKERKSGFGVMLAKCVAIALVFGLVAGGVFTGVSYVGTRALGITASDRDAGGSNQDGRDANAGNADSSVQQTSTGQAKDLTDVSSIVEEVMPSIVAITNIGTVTYQTFWGQQEYESQSCGSGIIVDQDDKYLYIVTNNHVVSSADTLTVQFNDDSTASCEVKGTVPAKDLAVVQVELKNLDADTLNSIKLATVGDSEALKVGEGAISIGNALGYGQAVSVGHISALGRTVTVQDQTTGTTIVNQNMIQTDAAINPGNSGGALLNARGEVIGINSVKYSDMDVEGFGFAIPMADAVPIVQQLIAGTYVEPQSAYLGIQGQDVSDDMAQSYNMPLGIYIYQVIPGSAAEQAGIRQGDIVTAFDGQQVATMSELKQLLAGYEAGQEVTITLQRLNNGYEEMQIEVTLGAQSAVPGSRR